MATGARSVGISLLKHLKRTGGNVAQGEVVGVVIDHPLVRLDGLARTPE